MDVKVLFVVKKNGKTLDRLVADGNGMTYADAEFDTYAEAEFYILTAIDKMMGSGEDFSIDKIFRAVQKAD